MSDKINFGEPVEGINVPCTTFTFTRYTSKNISVTLHYEGRLPQDLRLDFKEVLSFALTPDWIFLDSTEDRIGPMRIKEGQWKNELYPLMRKSTSNWLIRNAPQWWTGKKEYVHYAVYNEDEYLFIAALSEVDANWIDRSK